VRILIDHGSYEFLNLGDIAMIQSCVARLRQRWPDAEIMIVTRNAGNLAACCPGTRAITRISGSALDRLLPERYRSVWPGIAPYCTGRGRPARSEPRTPRTARTPRSLLEAVRAADVVVAAGGGYLTDAFWRQATGVLSVLSLAQRLGRPTAMFGQGIGPVTHRALRVQIRAVLRRLLVLGLREGVQSRELAMSLGVPATSLLVTGDEALELVPAATAAGTRLGVNLRVSGYSGIDARAAREIGRMAQATAARLRAPIAALPVSRHQGEADLGTIRGMLQPASAAEVILSDPQTPQDLIAATAGCRAVVTGSYHSAVFALAQGIPAVCLTGSSYYDGKFTGLAAQFGETCLVVPADGTDLAGRLGRAVDRAWHLPAQSRAAGPATARRLRDAGRDAYGAFCQAAELSAQFQRRPGPPPRSGRAGGHGTVNPGRGPAQTGPRGTDPGGSS
jgi:polysaccharide pyruvyl transferase WcaK-like protein